MRDAGRPAGFDLMPVAEEVKSSASAPVVLDPVRKGPEQRRLAGVLTAHDRHSDLHELLVLFESSPDQRFHHFVSWVRYELLGQVVARRRVARRRIDRRRGLLDCNFTDDGDIRIEEGGHASKCVDRGGHVIVRKA
ncbi:hypothetical protein BC938DRAFT_476026 [Jimgerdemannia flammicorona]|uniref:Uncharacterized protein n=1 Tax=Jimgerdemannia flammicorona TaxID=994334 RepID=A0A433QR05_9FUNG|nr:hypothetical protein BC938DRAFT_476026 [Jimgerdemannia flammicorona]